MISRNRNHQSGFTLVEIMIVVAIIGLLAALAFPSYATSRKQSQGRRIISDARMIDAAMDQVAMEKHLKDGDSTKWVDVASYIKSKGTGDLEITLQEAAPLDILNNAYVIGNVGPGQVKVSDTTKTALDNVGIDWGNF